MQRTRKSFYAFIISACMAGYGWIYYALHHASTASGIQVCFIKNVTHLPCPSCGTTRGVLSLIHGNFGEAFFTNPMSILAGLFLLILPFWLMKDLLLKRDSLFLAYKSSEEKLKKNKHLFVFFGLMFMNWMWNIYKGL